MVAVRADAYIHLFPDVPPGVHRESRDTTGLAIAFLTGIAVGVVLAAPVLPTLPAIPAGDPASDPVGAVLVAGALAAVLVPLAVLTLYQVYALADR